VVRPPYTVAVRLCIFGAERWALIDGAHPGIDLLSLPPDRYLNVVYTWLVERTPTDKMTEMEEQLRLPLPGQEDRVTAFQEEDEGASFMNTMAKLGGGAE
jgi:hypothetical protein